MPPGVVIYLMFGAWFGITLAVLLGMDVLERLGPDLTVRLNVWKRNGFAVFNAKISLKLAPICILRKIG